MNRSILRTLSLASLTMIAFALAISINAAPDDGIAASPKVRQTLNERKATTTPVVAAPLAMACPKCADLRSEVKGAPAKGAQILAGVKQVAYTHACSGCETKMTVAAEGKASHTVVAYKCTAEVQNNSTCCASK